MSYLSEYIIPGSLGKTFLLGANRSINYQRVLEVLREINGVSKVSLNEEVFPREITVFTERAIPVTEIQKKVRTIGFHAIAKATFLF